MVYGYQRPESPEQAQRDQEDREEALLSKHVGVVGAGLRFNAKDPLMLLRKGKPFDGRGGSRLAVLTLVHNLDRFKLFLEEDKARDLQPGDYFMCFANVNKHETFHGVKMTLLSLNTRKCPEAHFAKI
jgi:hypothetical protein